MKNLFYITLAVLTLTSCKQKVWNYEIHSEIVVDGKPKKCIFYADSVTIQDSTIHYVNSDGSKITIKEPYILIDRTHR